MEGTAAGGVEIFTLTGEDSGVISGEVSGAAGALRGGMPLGPALHSGENMQSSLQHS